MPLDLSRLEALRNGGAAAFKSKTPLQRGLSDISMEKIIPDPSQPRKVFDDETLDELADSIRNQGLIQPLLVRQDRDKFVIITGERRFRALEKIGAKTAKCIVRNDIPSEDIPYVQIAENMKRQDLSVVEIAEFICGRLKAGASQKLIAEKLGFTKAVVSQYSSYKDMPEVIRESLLTGKIKSIQTAYVLLQKFQEFPEKITEFVTKSEFISKSEAEKFDPEEPKKVSTEKLSSTYDSLNSPLSTSEETPEEDNAIDVEQEPIEEQATDTLDDEFDDSGEDSIMSGEEQEAEAENESSTNPISNSEEIEDFSPTLASDESTTESLSDEENPDKSEKLEDTADAILRDDMPEEFKNPVWLCFCDERDCELLWKRKPKADGFVFVKYEDGTEEEVPAELVRLNRVIEA